MTRRRAVAIAAAALAFAFAAPAAAFVRTRSACGAALFWPDPAVPYVVSSHASFPSPSCAATADADPALDAVRASFTAWEVSCSPRQIVYGGRIDDTRIGLGSDGEHLVVFRQGFCSVVAPACMQDPNADCATQFDCFEDRSPQDRRIVALTSVLYDQNSGRIVDADIEVNAWDGQGAGQSLSAVGGGPTHGWYFTCGEKPATACTTYGQDGCYYMDLQNTVTHEAGHFIGLAHVCEPAQGNCTAAMTPLTMFPSTSPGDVEKRTLQQDDVDGACASTRAEGQCGGSSNGGCASAGGAPAWATLLLAAAALGRRRRAGGTR